MIRGAQYIAGGVAPDFSNAFTSVAYYNRSTPVEVLSVYRTVSLRGSPFLISARIEAGPKYIYWLNYFKVQQGPPLSIPSPEFAFPKPIADPEWQVRYRCGGSERQTQLKYCQMGGLYNVLHAGGAPCHPDYIPQCDVYFVGHAGNELVDRSTVGLFAVLLGILREPLPEVKEGGPLAVVAVRSFQPVSLRSDKDVYVFTASALTWPRALPREFVELFKDWKVLRISEQALLLAAQRGSEDYTGAERELTLSFSDGDKFVLGGKRFVGRGTSFSGLEGWVVVVAPYEVNISLGGQNYAVFASVSPGTAPPDPLNPQPPENLIGDLWIGPTLQRLVADGALRGVVSLQLRRLKSGCVQVKVRANNVAKEVDVCEAPTTVQIEAPIDTCKSRIGIADIPVPCVHLQIEYGGSTLSKDVLLYRTDVPLFATFTDSSVLLIRTGPLGSGWGFSALCNEIRKRVPKFFEATRVYLQIDPRSCCGVEPFYETFVGPVTIAGRGRIDATGGQRFCSEGLQIFSGFNIGMRQLSQYFSSKTGGGLVAGGAARVVAGYYAVDYNAKETRYEVLMRVERAELLYSGDYRQLPLPALSADMAKSVFGRTPLMYGRFVGLFGDGDFAQFVTVDSDMTPTPTPSIQPTPTAKPTAPFTLDVSPVSGEYRYTDLERGFPIDLSASRPYSLKIRVGIKLGDVELPATYAKINNQYEVKLPAGAARAILTAKGICKSGLNVPLELQFSFEAVGEDNTPMVVDRKWTFNPVC